ncbi:TlpA family protein disulfide reductase [Desertivirga xinjiangensis]|uniref:TlpA family protein disulfide reductase n=1 Tax=Desertivirga xinjiangensis TaxID=539206 RepID=UPI00210E0B6F|nr:redoxin domain-containing protein [Pedobacter xinjiangensis]
MTQPPKNTEAECFKTFLITIGILLLIITIVLVSTLVNAQQQTKPLKIGEKLPELSITNVIDLKAGSINLTEHKGKLIILDFWATDCSSSAEYLLTVKKLQAKFNDRVLILPVTSQQATTVQAYLQASPKLSGLNQPIATGDTLLRQFFPYKTVPHIIWIDQKGVFRSVTYAEYLNADNIRQALTGGPMNWPQKDSEAPYDYNKPLAAIKSPAAGDKRNSLLTGYVPGASTRSGTQKDSSGRITRFYAINHTLLHLYAIAYQRGGLIFNPSRRILEVKDTAALVYSPKAGYLTEWERKHQYSYECSLPARTDLKDVYPWMRHDLDAMTGLKSSIEKRKVSCLVLKIKDVSLFRSQAQPTAQKRYVALGPEEETPFMQNAPLENLVLALNRISGFPPVLDETGFAGPADLRFSKPLNNLTSFKEELKKQGLLLQSQERELEMFILKEPAFTTDTTLTH